MVDTGETQGQGSTLAQAPVMNQDAMAEGDEPIPKKLNINTSKAHSLGDYARTICQLGTTDSYSNVIVSDS